jgi:DNA-binding NarL/FixJ family response regulator
VKRREDWQKGKRIRRRSRDCAVEQRRVLVADDHPLFRLGLTRLLEREQGLTVCAEARTGEEALRAAETSQPHLAVVDLCLGSTDGIELTRTLRQRYPSLSILVVSMFDDPHCARRALAAGANGYYCKHDEPEHFIEAMLCALNRH